MLLPIRSDADVVAARQHARALAQEMGFGATDVTLWATAISEIARNITAYAGAGELEITEARAGGQRGIQVIARDSGPGIADLERALQDGFSTGGGLGLGLPGARRLVDDFEIESTPGSGTVVTMRKWIR